MERAHDSDVSTRHARHEDRRQSAGRACLPFHGNPLPLNAMRFYSALWQEFENFRALSDHSLAANRLAQFRFIGRWMATIIDVRLPANSWQYRSFSNANVTGSGLAGIASVTG